MTGPGDILVITGIMAAGKSTIAQAIAERLPQSVHLRGDVFRRFIVNGQAAITSENWEVAVEQLHLRYRLATAAALTYSSAGFTVVYQDVILGREVEYVLDRLRPASARVFLIVLAPDATVAATRDRSRHKVAYGDWSPLELDCGLREDTPRIGFWIDNSSLSIDETADVILASLGAAQVVPTGL